MIQRCTNPKFHQFKDYGGRGIQVCDRWRESFEAFLADMGEPPEGHTLDRIQNYGDYEPGNCRWATRDEQRKNSRLRHDRIPMDRRAWRKMKQRAREMRKLLIG
jgi:hypothetical protein